MWPSAIHGSQSMRQRDKISTSVSLTRTFISSVSLPDSVTHRPTYSLNVSLAISATPSIATWLHQVFSLSFRASYCLIRNLLIYFLIRLCLHLLPHLLPSCLYSLIILCSGIKKYLQASGGFTIQFIQIKLCDIFS